MIKHGVARGGCSEDREEIEEFLRVDGMPACREKYERLVLINPDDYRSWNELKRIFLGDTQGLLKEQLLLTQKAIMVNPKSYFAWHHRYYLSVEGHSRMGAAGAMGSTGRGGNRDGQDGPAGGTADAARRLDEFVAHEQKLCSLLFSVDPRNFHCWNYCLKSGIHMAADYANYSSLQVHDNRAVELLYADPDDEGSWRFYTRIERSKRPGCFYVRLFRNHMDLVFKEPFCGELRINRDRVKIGGYVRCYRHSRGGDAAAPADDGIAIGVLQAPGTAPTAHKLRPLKSSRETIENILGLRPSCIFAMKEKLKHTKDLEERGAIVSRLCELDKLRQRYYRSLLDGYYEVYVIEEQ